MTVRIRPNYQAVTVLEVDQRPEDWLILVETEDGDELLLPEGMVVADGGIGEVIKQAARIVK